MIDTIFTSNKNLVEFHMFFAISFLEHYEKKLTKNIRPTDVLQIYTSI